MNIRLTLSPGESIVTGKQVSFEAPCDSEGLTGVIVDNITYDLVDSLGHTLPANSFDKGAIVSVIFNVESLKAFVQNAGTSKYIEDNFLKKTFTGNDWNVNMTGHRLTGLPLPQAGSEPATKEFVENFTVEGSTYVATDDNKDGNIVLRPYVADADELEFRDHIKNKNNPHGVTPAQIGAAPSGYGYGGSSIFLGSVTTEDELSNALETAYKDMANGETKMLRWYGYPSNEFNFFGILARSSENYGSVIVHSAYYKGELCSKTKSAGVWQPLKYERTRSLKDFGITTFPTTMAVVTDSMPRNSSIALDSRLVIAGGEEEISDLGNSSAGMYIFFRGTSNARMTVLNIYGATSANTGYMNFGNYASSAGRMNWIMGDRQSSSYPNCYCRTVDGETEWVNPPMAPGVEYRTTERWSGKAVYTKLIPIGSITSGNHDIDHNTSMVVPISIDIVNNDKACVTGSNLVDNLSFSRTQIYLHTTSSFGNIKAVIKYTKEAL